MTMTDKPDPFLSQSEIAEHRARTRAVHEALEARRAMAGETPRLDNSQLIAEILRLIRGATDPAIHGPLVDGALLEFVSVLVGDVVPTTYIHAMNSYCNALEAIDRTLHAITGADIDCIATIDCAKLWSIDSLAVRRQASTTIVGLVMNHLAAAAPAVVARIDPDIPGVPHVLGYVVDVCEHIVTVDVWVSTEREAAEVYIAAADELGSSLRRPEIEGEVYC
jgi:hypothetical protein